MRAENRQKDSKNLTDNLFENRKISKKDHGTIQLHKEIYSEEAIHKGVLAYKNIADIGIEESERHWICKVYSSCYEPELVLNEFENYVIDILNSQN